MPERGIDWRAEADELRRGLGRLRNVHKLLRPADVGMTPADVVHRENKWSLLRYRGRQGSALRTPVLLVPSLINRHYVLDLAPGRSFVEYLLAQGHDVWIIDWGRPTAEDRYLRFADFAERYIGRAVRITARHAAAGKVHLLGYCLGGTLTAIYTALNPERVASLVTLAAPVAFEEAGLLGTWTRSPTFDVRALVAGAGNVPWQILQASFHLMRPTLTLSKAAHALDRLWDDEFLEGFLATERWGNDNVSFPGRAYVEYIEHLYRGDELLAGELHIEGRRVDLGAIRCPTLVVSFEQDTIVPHSCAAPLYELCSSTDKQLLALRGGHVGAVVSRKAATRLWPTLSDWWRERDGRRAARKRRSAKKRPA